MIISSRFHCCSHVTDRNINLHHQIYEDRALECQLHARPTCATHWALLDSHASRVGLIEETAGVLQCELELHEPGLPSHYDEADAAEHRDWLVYDVIDFMAARMPYLWLQGLASLVGDEDVQITASNTFYLYSPSFRARDPDQIEVRQPA